jgi:hypothetical protein
VILDSQGEQGMGRWGLTLLLVLANESPEQKQIYENAQATRDKIRSGVVELEVRHFKPDADAQDDGELFAKYHTAFDADHLRTDLTMTGQSREPGLEGAEKGVVLKQILTSDSLISHSTALSRGLPLSARIDHGEALKQLAADNRITMLDPRVIGWFINAPGHFWSLREHALEFNPQIKLAERIEEEQVRGTKCWRMDFEWKSDGAAASYWLAPDTRAAQAPFEHAVCIHIRNGDSWGRFPAIEITGRLGSPRLNGSNRTLIR